MRLKKVLHVSDSHWPFVDRCAFNLMIDLARDFKPDEIVILGDFFDVYSCSRHDKDPLMDFKTWQTEFMEARDGLELISSLNSKKVTFLAGNHEVRLESYINNFCPKMAGLFKQREVLCIPDKWDFYPYGQEGHYKIGKLTVCHGARAGENPAASMVKKYRNNVLFGHTHKLQEYHITDIHGQDFVALNAGWLGNVRQAGKYIKDVADWSLGFAVTWHKDNGDFFYQLIHIRPGIPYESMFNGVVYKK